MAIVVTMCILYRAETDDKNVSSPPRTTSNPSGSPSISEGKIITVTGEIVCLSKKDTRGPVEASCAIGLMGVDGNNYVLGAEDPTLLGGIPTGETVHVRGLFTAQSSGYDSVGIIKVDSLEQ